MTLRGKRLGVGDLLALGLVIAFACVHAGRSATLLSTGPNLQAALLKAAAGDVVTLPPGPAGDVYLKGVAPAGVITVRAQDPLNPPSLNTLAIINSANLVFDGVNVDYQPTLTTYAFTSIARIQDSKNITIRGGHIIGGPAINGVDPTATALDAYGTVKGLPAGYGVNITNSPGVKLLGVEIAWATQAIVLNVAPQLEVRGVYAHDVRKTFMLGALGDDAVIADSRFERARPWRYGQTPIGDHGDWARFWAVSGQAVPFRGPTITGNSFIQADGLQLLGLAFEGSSVAGPAYAGAVIENNKITSASGSQGIIPSGVRGGSIKGNVLLSASTLADASLAAKQAPGILLTADVSGFTVSGNVAGSITNKGTGNVIAADNVIFSGLASAYSAPAPIPTVDPRDAQIASLTDQLKVATATIGTLQGQVLADELALKTANDNQKATQASLDAALAASAAQLVALTTIETTAAAARAAAAK